MIYKNLYLEELDFMTIEKIKRMLDECEYIFSV